MSLARPCGSKLVSEAEDERRCRSQAERVDPQVEDGVLLDPEQRRLAVVHDHVERDGVAAGARDAA